MKLLKKWPANNSNSVCIDTELILNFDETPMLNNQGKLYVYDYNTDEEIDCIDFSIPAGPTKAKKTDPFADYIKKPYEYNQNGITNKNTIPGTPSAKYQQEKEEYQLTIIGGFSDGFHFYPVTIKNNSVFIMLHHNLLDYNHKYYVILDPNAFVNFDGIQNKEEWAFTTKNQPVKTKRTLLVSKDDEADFRSLQGALDFIPDHQVSKYTIYIKDGDYQEIVYTRNKDNITIIGESREGVCIHYANNEIFNPHPRLIKTNEKLGTFPSRRAVVAFDNCTHIILKNMTIKNDSHGQAEGLLINGSYNYFKNLHIIGSGDALQTNGSAYYDFCIIEGEGDTILGRGPAFFKSTTLYSYNAFMWIRNPKENHGNVFINCTFHGKNDNAVIARLPNNKGMQYPDAECVLIDCELNNIPPIGFYPIDPDAYSAKLLEFNSHDKSGSRIDVSKRHACVKILSLEKDLDLINKYMDYHYVLGEEFQIEE